MHSSVNWALLGLIIERPSYAYELAQRFERTYGDALSLSSVSHAYTALGTLKDRELIEELPGTRGGRQPKPHYRATAKGLGDYHERLIGQVAEERKRQKVFLLQLTALTRNPEQAMSTIDDYEQACLAETCTTRIAAPGDSSAADPSRELQARLIAEEKRLAIAAKISWARYARSELKALAAARANGQANGQNDEAANGQTGEQAGRASGGQASGRGSGR
jgi:DNA-binding PadR family transcriptional regulator